MKARVSDSGVYQKLCEGADPSARGAKAEAPVPSGVESVEECSHPSRLGSMGKRREAPATNAFSAYSRPQNGSRRKTKCDYDVV